MENGDRILNYISQKENVSQRELALHTGLSLGSINLLIRQLAKKGFITMERLRPNTLRYMLTPQGIAERTLKTYRYVLGAFRHVLSIRRELEWIARSYHEKGYSIYLYGSRDEIGEILRQLTGEGALRRIRWIEGLEELATEETKVLVLIWQAERQKELQEQELEFLNLLSEISMEEISH